MKRHLTICIALVALMTSCVEEPTILRLLPAEDAAAIPYQMDQTVSFVNQDGDTLAYTVVMDTLSPYNGEYFEFPYNNAGAKMEIIPQDYCYARLVYLKCEATGDLLGFVVAPDKEFYFIWNHDYMVYRRLSTDPVNTYDINGITYEGVHHEQYYSTSAGELEFQWFYSEAVGLIAVKYKDRSLTIR